MGKIITDGKSIVPDSFNRCGYNHSFNGVAYTFRTKGKGHNSYNLFTVQGFGYGVFSVRRGGLNTRYYNTVFQIGMYRKIVAVLSVAVDVGNFCYSNGRSRRNVRRSYGFTVNRL